MQFWALLKKELLNLVRDKKAFVALFLPLFLFPLLYVGLGSQLKDVEKTVGNEIKIYSNIQEDNEKKAYLQKLLPDVDIVFVKTEAPQESLKAEEIYLIVDFAEENIEELPICVEITYNTNSNYSTAAYSIVAAAFESANIQILCEKLSEKGVDLSVMDNIRLSVKEASTNMILVMLITSLLMSGGASIASDIFAGEKERGTLEQLAVTQVKRGTLLCVKTLAVFLVTLLNACISVLAYYISIKLSPDITKIFGGGEVAFSLSGEAVLYLIATIAVFALFISSILIFISLNAKSVKEAQGNMAILTMLPSILSLLVMFSPMSGISVESMAIPVYNVLMGLKMIFGDSIAVAPLLIMLCSQLLYVVVINIFSARIIRGNKFLL